MSQTGQNPGYLNPDVERLEAQSEAIVGYRRDLSPGEVIPPHRHRRHQLVYASEGVMTVTTARGAFVVPPQRGVWLPGGVEHRIDARGAVSMRTLYVEPHAAQGLPAEVCVLHVTPLLRELLLAAVAQSQTYRPNSPEDRLMSVILDQIRVLPVAPLALPMPSDRRLRRVAEGLLANPADSRGLDDWAAEVGASARTLARLFRRELAMSFRAWRQQLRLLRALESLAAGDAVTTVALDLGYDSPSAFIAMFRRNLGTTPTRYFAATA